MRVTMFLLGLATVFAFIAMMAGNLLDASRSLTK